MGWLRHRLNAFESKSELVNDEFKGRFFSYISYVRKLLSFKDGGFPIHDPLRRQPSKVIFVDASGDIGCGAVEIIGRFFLFKKWTKDEMKSASRKSSISSAHLELLNIALTICSISAPGDVIQVYSDSMAAVNIAKKKYCPIGPTQDILICLDRFCLSASVTTLFTHVPRDDKWIKICDSLSRSVVCLSLSKACCLFIVGTSLVGGLWLEAFSLREPALVSLLVSFLILFV